MYRAACFVLAIAVVSIGLFSMSSTQAQDKEKEKKHLTFEIFKDKQEEYRWRLKATNGQIIATGGQGYKAKADCKHGIELIQQGAATAKITEEESK